MTSEHLEIIKAIDNRSSCPPSELYIRSRGCGEYCVLFKEGNSTVEGRAWVHGTILEDIWWGNAWCSVQSVLDEQQAVWHKYTLGTV